MSETKHTAGPWVSGRANYPQDGEYDYAIVAGGKVIAEAFGRVAKGDDGLRPAEANSRLMAAAPDLLAALKAILADMPSPSDAHEATKFVAAHAAISKAEGRTA